MYRFYEPYWRDRDPTDEEILKSGCWHVAAFIIGIVLLLILCALTGCTTTRYVAVPVSHTDTLIITKAQRDSIYLRDSTHVSEQQHGDTILLKITKWHTEYRDREVHDTLYQAKVDTVPMPYPVPEYVEKPLSWWQRTRIHLGEVFLGVLGLLLIAGLWKLRGVLVKVI